MISFHPYDLTVIALNKYTNKLPVSMMALNLIDINEDLMVSLISMVLTFWEQYLYVSN